MKLRHKILLALGLYSAGLLTGAALTIHGVLTHGTTWAGELAEISARLVAVSTEPTWNFAVGQGADMTGGPTIEARKVAKR